MAGFVEESLAQACADLAVVMARPDAADEVLRSISAHLVKILRAQSAGVVLADADGGLEVVTAAGELIDVVAAEEDLGQGPCLEALRLGEATCVPSLTDAALHWPRWTEQARSRGIGAWAAVPADAEGGTILLCAASTRPRRWDDCEIAAAQALADIGAGCVARETELGRARRTVEQLQEALDRRLVIEQAKGILAGELGCSLDQAFEILRSQARRKSATVRSVAHAVVDLGLRPPRSDDTGAPWTG